MADIEEQKTILAKYTSSINDAALQKMAKTYALVMSNKDSKFVSCGDESERTTVRENFLKKKLGLAAGDAELDAMVSSICEKMQEDRFKSRLVFYYLLAEKAGKLSDFT
jgi:hypothetical protein